MPDLATVFQSLLSSVFWALVGVLLLVAAFRIFDLSDPVHYHAEIEKGNMAAGVVVAGVMVGMAIIIYAAIR